MNALGHDWCSISEQLGRVAGNAYWRVVYSAAQPVGILRRFADSGFDWGFVCFFFLQPVEKSVCVCSVSLAPRPLSFTPSNSCIFFFPTCAKGFSCGLPHRTISANPELHSQRQATALFLKTAIRTIWLAVSSASRSAMPERCVVSEIAPYSLRTAPKPESAQRRDGTRCGGDASRRFSRRVVVVAAAGAPERRRFDSASPCVPRLRVFEAVHIKVQCARKFPSHQVII